MQNPLTRPLALSATAFTALILIAPTPVFAAPPSSFYTLAWADEFNGTTVDTSKWNYRTDVKHLSAQRSQNVTVGGGVMTIHLKKEPYAGMQYTGGGLVSKQAVRYGYYETRAKTSIGSGWHPAFWAMAGDGSTTFPSYRRTEIDGFELNSHARRNITYGVHRWSGPSGSDVYGSHIGGGGGDVGFDPSAAFHTYGFEWTETAVRFYIDGQLKFTGNYPASSGVHDYINVWLTAIAVAAGGPGVDDSALPGQVQFDYFRFYMKDGYTDNEGPTASRYSETGTWTTSTLRGHTLENVSRYSGTAGATATWRGWVPAAGTYDVYIYKIVSTGNDTNARIDVTHNGGTSTQFLNYATGTTGWVKLGTWSFSSGESGTVKVIRGNGNARADAVKFLRVS